MTQEIMYQYFGVNWALLPFKFLGTCLFLIAISAAVDEWRGLKGEKHGVFPYIFLTMFMLIMISVGIFIWIPTW